MTGDRIEASATKDGSIKVERFFANALIDRFIFKHGAEIPKHFCTSRRADIDLLSQPSAEVVIDMPEMPIPEPSQAQLLEAAQRQIEALQDKVDELEEERDNFSDALEDLRDEFEEQPVAHDPESQRD